MASDFEPKDDGVTHINVYSKGKTRLGKQLTNFARTPFVHTKYGNFQSVEGLWYWLLTGQSHEKLRQMYGYDAKKFGKQCIPSTPDNEPVPVDDDFKEDLLEGIRCKLRQNQHILFELAESTLPLAHYYYYGDENKNPKVHYLPKFDWIMDELERIREVSREYVKAKKDNAYKRP